MVIPNSLEKKMCFNERIWDPVLKMHVLNECGNSSYRNTETICNGLLRRNTDEAFSFRTLQHTILQEGRDSKKETEKFTKDTLPEYGFDPKTGKPVDTDKIPASVVNPVVTEAEQIEDQERVRKAVNFYNSTRDIEDEQICMENALNKLERPLKKSVIVCIDDVGVHQQKEKRIKHSKEKAKKTAGDRKPKDARIGKTILNTTVAYIISEEGEYRIAADSVQAACLTILAYLLKNRLLEDRDLYFFFDGAKNLLNCVSDIFSFRPFTIHLDWFHVEKHCRETFAMALKGGAKNKERNANIRYEFNKRLFAGNVEAAKQYLDNLSPDVIKDEKKLQEIKDYLDRKIDAIYPYAVRKVTGEINSSNRGEKSNDMIIAQRCKHNGMSWSCSGLRGIREIHTLSLNQETSWYTNKTIVCAPVPKPSKKQIA